jgi:deoxyribodipyrimidine photo-lyase
VTKPLIIWFRNDLRLLDNPIIQYASATNKPIIPIYILDQTHTWQPGAASKLWLHHSLISLSQDLNNIGSQLIILEGDSAKTLKQFIQDSGADEIVWNKRYEPELSIRDEQIVPELDIETKICNGSLILNLDSIKNKQGLPFKVFTPFYKHCLSFLDEHLEQEYPRQLSSEIKLNTDIKLEQFTSLSINDLKLLESPNHKWQESILKHFSIGERAAQASLEKFTKQVSSYNELRDRPDIEGTSQLSPHLCFGELSPYRIWQRLKSLKNNEPYLRQLIWREFAYYIMHHFPYSTEQNFKAEFNKFPWVKNQALLEKWQQGMTGYPIVDAGMRELWATGWMHNRVRMIVGSFLVKDLLIDWRQGAKWFWDTLVDADLANNSMGWQWVAGSGVDASPFFRIFNPSTQAEKFDPNGDYVRKWIPELDTDAYPLPIVNHDAARKEALIALKSIKI